MTHDNQKTIREKIHELCKVTDWPSAGIMEYDEILYEKILNLFQPHHQKELEELREEIQKMKNPHIKSLVSITGIDFAVIDAYNRVSQLIDQFAKGEK